MKLGLIGANMGDYLYKKRIAIPGQGKSGGYRTMIGAVVGSKYFFLYMFSKNSKANVNHKEKLALKELAKSYIRLDQVTIDNLLIDGELVQVESMDE